MARKEKHWEDDDGRTIADMSQVKRPSLFGNLPGSAYQREEQPEEREEAKESPPWVDDSQIGRASCRERVFRAV